MSTHISHMSISYLYLFIIMANLNNRVPQLPYTLDTGGSVVTKYDNYDRSLLSDIDPDFNYLHYNNINSQ